MYDLDHFYKQSFISLYLRTTMLRQLSTRLEAVFVDEMAPYPPSAPQRFPDTVAYVETIASMPEATFAVIHLLEPGSSVSFDAQGEILPEAKQHPNQDNYFEELLYINSRFLQLFDRILQESDRQAVIIFQADHGSTLGDKRTADGRFAHFDIYAAYFLPESSGISFPRHHTTINTFPLLLNELFEADFDLNENRLVELEMGYKDPFQQRDVTESYMHE